jgi:hypothetical protein
MKLIITEQQLKSVISKEIDELDTKYKTPKGSGSFHYVYNSKQNRDRKSYYKTAATHRFLDCDILFDSMHRHHQSSVGRGAQLATNHGNDGGQELS